MCVQSLHHVWFFVSLRTVGHQAPLFMGFSRLEHWNGLPGPPPGDLPDSRIKPVSRVSPALQVDSLPTRAPRKPLLPRACVNWLPEQHGLCHSKSVTPRSRHLLCRLISQRTHSPVCMCASVTAAEPCSEREGQSRGHAERGSFSFLPIWYVACLWFTWHQ